MDYLKQRQKTRGRLYSKVTIAGLVLLLALLVHPTWKIFMKSIESRRNLEKAQAELTELETRKQRLAGDVAYLNTEHGRDQEIRSKFGVVREGETMVVIVRNDPEPKPSEPAPEASFLARVRSGFLGIFGVE